MLLSQIFAWVSALLCLLEVMKFFARVSKRPGLNRFFHKYHIPFGILLLVTGTAHGLLAGNPASASLPEARVGEVFFTVNLGTACFFCAVLLAGTYLLRKKLRRSWMPLHRLLTLGMTVLLVLHLADVGIGLPENLSRSWAPETPAVSSAPPVSSLAEVTSPSPSPSLSPSPSPSPLPTPESSPSAEPSSALEAAEPEASPLPESTEVPSGGLQDGVYTGSAEGRNGPITVQVTVEAGAISYIEVLSHSETPKYYARAEEVISSILAAGSPDVDSITGATISSDGIKAAVANALES